MIKGTLPVKEIIFILLAIAVVFFVPHAGIIPFPFGYTVVIAAGIWFFLKRTNENFSSLGFSFKRFEWKAVYIGAITAILAFVFLQYIFFPLLNKVVHLEKANLEDFKQVRHHTANYIFFLILSWLAGGWYEELVFRGFIFTRLEKIMPAQYNTGICFILTCIIFAVYHYQLGSSGMINALMAGSIYHAIIMKYKRNLWYSIFAHGFFDTIAFTYIYLGYC